MLQKEDGQLLYVIFLTEFAMKSKLATKHLDCFYLRGTITSCEQ